MSIRTFKEDYAAALVQLAKQGVMVEYPRGNRHFVAILAINGASIAKQLLAEQGKLAWRKTVNPS
jgi:hypothetical protein